MRFPTTRRFSARPVWDSIRSMRWSWSLGLEKEFGVVVEDRATAVKVLASIRTIADYIQSQGKG